MASKQAIREHNEVPRLHLRPALENLEGHGDGEVGIHCSFDKLLSELQSRDELKLEDGPNVSEGFEAARSLRDLRLGDVRA